MKARMTGIKTRVETVSTSRERYWDANLREALWRSSDNSELCTILQMKEVLEKYLEDEDDMLDLNLTAK